MIFRSPVNNARFTKQLFYDMMMDIPIENRTEGVTRFTLHHDKEGYINFRKEYVSDMDKTGYKTATRLLEDYSHWKLLMKRSWFREAKEQWDDEIDAKQESEANTLLRKVLRDDEAKRSEQIAAAKALLGRVAKPHIKAKGPETRGRPSNEEVKGNLKQMTEEEKELQDDLRRIGLLKEVINGDG